MKGNIYTSSENDDNEESFLYLDFWFDEKQIAGFYRTDENHVDNSVNIFLGSNLVTLQASKELIDYLTKTFI